eukprot:706654-Pyramimonas_sp.AAC.1
MGGAIVNFEASIQGRPGPGSKYLKPIRTVHRFVEWSPDTARREADQRRAEFFCPRIWPRAVQSEMRGALREAAVIKRR